MLGSTNMLQAVDEKINFPLEEECILKFWDEYKIFEECMKKAKGRPRYSFFDGPPFATGLPHYGHILAGTIKDIMTRYAHQNGFHVERRFGWDCHGLPVEFEIDKVLNIKGPDDVKRIGIATYNNECRKIVTRYSGEWEKVVTRLGRWIDFKNDYKTMYPWYMESIWWVFSELWNKGLVYRGVKVMPYSTACHTPLSNFESGQNFKEVVDPAVVIKFPLENEPNVNLLAWTTTPWTLPSNLALCVNPGMIYVKVKDVDSDVFYIVMESRLSSVFKPNKYEIVEKFEGKELTNLKYTPLFPYFAKQPNAFIVLTDTYVTDDSGTGIVHQAPYFGEDDYRVCLKFNVITPSQDIVCPVDENGCFTAPVTEFQGQYVKDADKHIIKHLKGNDRVFSSSTVSHNYPFCWRSETPLIYKAVPSWFIRVQHLSNDLIERNRDTHWVPDFVKDKRFGNWLKDAKDWAISRNRYWGTPIPLWVSEDQTEYVCVSSIAELEKLSGVNVKDLHRETVDEITIPSVNPLKKPLRRVSEVFDCWFESGSMPYAQFHYPFENKKEFLSCFPADFIAEGIDQTRGWFYTLLVISTALFNKPPFKNLIANGLILAADGQKMSKRKKNYPDPMEVVSKCGADALRLYLINSPVVRAENLRFQEKGVRDVLKDVFLPWYNAYRFLVQNILIFMERGTDFKLKGDERPTNIMDRWILSFTQSLLIFVRNEMAAYRLYTVVPRLVKFIENLTNWYVRMNRKRFKGQISTTDTEEALATLGNVLFTMIKVMAPFTPFLCELMYQNLKQVAYEFERSVHFLMIPEPKLNLVEESIERSVSKMQTIIDLGRIIRERNTLPIKNPLKELVIIHSDQSYLDEINDFKSYIIEELNVHTVTLSTDKAKYGVTLKAQPDSKELGIRLKSEFKQVNNDIKALTDEQLQEFQKTGSINIRGHELKSSDLRIKLGFSGPAASELSKTYEADSSGDVLVLLDIKPDEKLIDEGIAREIVNRIQKLKKKAGLTPLDTFFVSFVVVEDSNNVRQITEKHKTFIENSIKSPLFLISNHSQIIIQEEQTLRGAKVNIVLSQGDTPLINPYCRYVNVMLNGVITPGYGKPLGETGSVWLENPVGENILTFSQLKKEIENLFGIYNRSLMYKVDSCELPEDVSVETLSSKLIVVEPYYGRENVDEFMDLRNLNMPVTGFENLVCKGKKACVFMENPLLFTLDDNLLQQCIKDLFNGPSLHFTETRYSDHLEITFPEE